MLIHRAQTVFFASVASVAQIVPPDFVTRETELKSVLSFIANTQGHSQTTFTDDIVDPVDLSFDQIYDPALEAKAKAIYTKDYEIFGFGDYAA
jgi:hypothetical protein